MFTVKIVQCRDGKHHTRGVEAYEYELFDTATEHGVIAHTVRGDALYIFVRGGDDPGELASVVFVENANGKTTDVVRA